MQIFRKHNIIDSQKSHDYLRYTIIIRCMGMNNREQIVLRLMKFSGRTDNFVVSERYPKKLLGYLRKQREFPRNREISGDNIMEEMYCQYRLSDQ